MTDFAVITGMSGAGRSTAANVLEDQGWFVIDNMPVALVPDMFELSQRPGHDLTRLALVVGSNAESSELSTMIDNLRRAGSDVRVLFLDARDDVLVRRFESTRRRHPVSAGDLLSAAIERERLRLSEMRAAADVVIDTSDLNVHELRERVLEHFADVSTDAAMQITLLSFGYKHGVPLDVDMVMDCRFLPNPHWVDELRPLTGLDPEVRHHVLDSELAVEFNERIDSLLDLLLPAYQSEGKSYLTVAFGCTGGRHRSVAIAEALGQRLADRDIKAGVVHRDVEKAP